MLDRFTGVTRGIVAAALLLVVAPLSAAEIPRLLPEDTDGLVTIASIDRIHDVFGIRELRARYPAEFVDVSAEMLETIGVDLFDPEWLHAAGIATDKPVFIAWMSDPAGAVVAFVPGDESTLDQITAMDDDGVQTRRDVGGTTVRTWRDDNRAAFVSPGNVVFVAIGDDSTGGALRQCQELLSGGAPTLGESPRYRLLAGKVKGESDIDVYIGARLYSEISRMGTPARVAEHGMDTEEAEKMYERLGLTNSAALYRARLLPDRVSVEGYAYLGKGSPLLDWYRPDTDPVTFLGRLPAAPWLVTVGRVNGRAMWSSLSGIVDEVRPDSLPRVAEKFAEFKEETGIDVEADIINQINGNTGFLTARVNMIGADAVAFVQVADREHCKKTISVVAEALRAHFESVSIESGGTPQVEFTDAEHAGVTYYMIASPRFGELCFGLVEDHVVITLSNTRFTDIVNGGSSFLNGIASEPVTKALRDPTGGTFYIDFEGMARDVRGFVAMLAPDAMGFVELLESFDNCAGTTTLDDEGIHNRFRLVSRESGMWQGLLTMMMEHHALGGEGP